MNLVLVQSLLGGRIVCDSDVCPRLVRDKKTTPSNLWRFRRPEEELLAWYGRKGEVVLSPAAEAELAKLRAQRMAHVRGHKPITLNRLKSIEVLMGWSTSDER